MKINIINVGNKLNKWESDGIGYYQKQLPKNIKISLLELAGIIVSFEKSLTPSAKG